jgi:hypothetical protein
MQRERHVGKLWHIFQLKLKRRARARISRAHVVDDVLRGVFYAGFLHVNKEWVLCNCMPSVTAFAMLYRYF